VAGRVEISVVQAAYPISRAHRAVRWPQCAHAWQQRLDLTRRPA